MLGMIQAYSSIKRVLALALPVCLIWALLACVFVCASHVEESSQSGDPAICVNVAAPDDDDCCPCPIVVSTGVRSERVSIDVSGDIINAQPLVLAKDDLPPGTQARTFTPAFSPPLARLCTLRI